MNHRGRSPGAGVVWSRVEDGFHVGSRNGALLGYIIRERDRRFTAYDMRSRPIGKYPDLTEAMHALVAVTLGIGQQRR
ncbi:hypothetical protein [Microbacterium invictum]|uniref:Uncharacterized protein n=1 Tax=Microbacterium invictum TaxID=515415 RepID=A0ABZ0VBZ0_9MICO|nr:hypothetical protein [Microbacterium invictum]WQB71138.1 hypothetical protein T9R20_04000 [Microbacterium invictum]